MKIKSFLFPTKLIRGTIISRPNRFIMMVQNHETGTVEKCHCPVTGDIGYLNFNKGGIPCLLSEPTKTKSGNTTTATQQRSTAFTVEAISLMDDDYCYYENKDEGSSKSNSNSNIKNADVCTKTSRGRKLTKEADDATVKIVATPLASSPTSPMKWIGINQMKANAFVHHFLEQGCLFQPTVLAAPAVDNFNRSNSNSESNKNSCVTVTTRSKLLRSLGEGGIAEASTLDTTGTTDTASKSESTKDDKTTVKAMVKATAKAAATAAASPHTAVCREVTIRDSRIDFCLHSKSSNNSSNFDGNYLQKSQSQPHYIEVKTPMHNMGSEGHRHFDIAKHKRSLKAMTTAGSTVSTSDNDNTTVDGKNKNKSNSNSKRNSKHAVTTVNDNNDNTDNLTNDSRLVKHMHALATLAEGTSMDDKAQCSILLFFMHNAAPFVPPTETELAAPEGTTLAAIRSAVKRMKTSGVTSWQLNVEIDEIGVHYKDHFKLNL